MAEKITLEMLTSTGMTEEQAKKILENIEGSNKKNNKIPFSIAKALRKMDCSECLELANNLVAGIEIDEEDEEIIGAKYVFGTRPKVRILKKMCQYTKYDVDDKSKNIYSNILPVSKSKKCVDLKTGKSIIKMMEEDSQIKYQQITLMVAQDINTKEWVPCIMYIHGAMLSGFINDETEPLNANIKTEMQFEFEERKKGKSKFLYPINFELNELSWEEYRNFKNFYN